MEVWVNKFKQNSCLGNAFYDEMFKSTNYMLIVHQTFLRTVFFFFYKFTSSLRKEQL